MQILNMNGIVIKVTFFIVGDNYSMIQGVLITQWTTNNVV